MSKKPITTTSFTSLATTGRAKAAFGTVVVSGAAPDSDVVRRNIGLGTEALARVGKKLLKPGVAIRAKKDVPQYAAAEGEPGVFIRRLNGRIERGRLHNGVFKVLE